MLTFEKSLKHPVYRHIPVQTLDALTDYVENHSDLNGFLLAVVANDLSTAVRHANAEDLLTLQHLVEFIQQELPAGCRGSLHAVACWLMFKPSAA